MVNIFLFLYEQRWVKHSSQFYSSSLHTIIIKTHTMFIKHIWSSPHFTLHLRICSGTGVQWQLTIRKKPAGVHPLQSRLVFNWIIIWIRFYVAIGVWRQTKNKIKFSTFSLQINCQIHSPRDIVCRIVVWQLA